MIILNAYPEHWQMLQRSFNFWHASHQTKIISRNATFNKQKHCCYCRILPFKEQFYFSLIEKNQGKVAWCHWKVFVGCVARKTQAAKQENRELKWANPLSTLSYKIKLCLTKEEYNRCGTEWEAKNCTTFMQNEGFLQPTILYSRCTADQTSIAISQKENME